MIQDIVLETAQAMNALQLSMSYTTAVTKLAMDAREAAAQMITCVKNPPAAAPMRIIDTYA